VVTVVESGASRTEFQVAVRLSPTSPLNVTSGNPGPSEEPADDDSEADSEAFAFESLSDPLSESLPQAARAGMRRAAHRAAAGRRSRRSTGSSLLFDEDGPATVAADPERVLCARA
jgi:hypothetical protein